MNGIKLHTVMRNLYEIWAPKRDQSGYRARYDITTMDSKRTVCEIPIRLGWLRIQPSDTILDNNVGKLQV
jgi:hypothetical protein